jgi:hypothetical protein
MVISEKLNLFLLELNRLNRLYSFLLLPMVTKNKSNNKLFEI